MKLTATTAHMVQTDHIWNPLKRRDFRKQNKRPPLSDEQQTQCILASETLPQDHNRAQMESRDNTANKIYIRVSGTAAHA